MGEMEKHTVHVKTYEWDEESEWQQAKPDITEYVRVRNCGAQYWIAADDWDQRFDSGFQAESPWI